MDLRKIKKLIEIVEESGISELEVRQGEEAIRIVRPLEPAVRFVPAEALPVRSADTQSAAPARSPSGYVVKAPLAGTFYRAPAPGERPFVKPGQTVEVGDVLCIIESMKMMNQIEAERPGRVAEVLIDDGRPIGAGQPLFRFD